MEAIAGMGQAWALGGTNPVSGKPVTVRAWYGLATMNVGAVQLRDGQVFARVEQRPTWIIDYGNAVMKGAGCPGCPPPVYSHPVYAVDAPSGTVYLAWGYNPDEEPRAEMEELPEWQADARSAVRRLVRPGD